MGRGTRIADAVWTVPQGEGVSVSWSPARRLESCDVVGILPVVEPALRLGYHAEVLHCHFLGES
jgi:hypothetical protein